MKEPVKTILIILGVIVLTIAFLLPAILGL
jgi:hypothetical protein